MTMPYNYLATLFAELAERGRESRTSVTLHDTLLPKLISGDMRIDTAERFIKESTI